MSTVPTAIALAPPVLMGLMAALARRPSAPARLWRHFMALAAAALLCSAISLALQLIALVDPGAAAGASPLPGLATSLTGGWLAVLVSFLGAVIGAFSSRYLQGEPDQSLFVGALAGVLAAVHVLLLADHWALLIVAWAVVGSLLQRLLCFYRERPFALLAAHKKRLADRLADLFLVVAAATAWWQVGSGSLSALRWHLVQSPASAPLQVSAVCVVVAVMLRTALLPVGPLSHWAHRLAGPALVAALTGAALLAHALPFGVLDAPDDRAGMVALIGLGLLHGIVIALQWCPEALASWRRRTYAGFYLDEFYTRAALTHWPTRWSPAAGAAVEHCADPEQLRATS